MRHAGAWRRPRLTRCGLGVIDGVPGRPPTLIAADVAAHSGRGRHRRAPARAGGRDRGVARRAPARRDGGGAGVQPAQRPDGDGHRTGGRGGVVCAARRGLPVALHTPSEVKAAVTGNGRAGKDQVTAMVMRLLRMDTRRGPPTPPTPWRWPSAICGAAGARPRLAAAAGAARAEARAVISHLDGRVSAIAPEGAVIEVGGVGLLVQCTPGTLATLRPGSGPGSRPRWWSGRTRSPCSASRPTMSGTCSSCCRPPAVSGPGSRSPCWPCSPRTRCAARSPRRTSPRSPGSPASAARVRNGLSWNSPAARPHRARAGPAGPAGRGRARRRAPALAGPGQGRAGQPGLAGARR